MARFESLAVQAVDAWREQPPDVARLWRLASSPDLPEGARRLLDARIRWALGTYAPGSAPAEMQLLGAMASMAVADGHLDDDELRLIARTLLLGGRFAPDDFAAVQRTLVHWCDQVKADGLGPTLDRLGLGVDAEHVKPVLLRLAALVLLADAALAVHEPAAARRLARAIGATEAELSDAVLGAWLEAGVR